jgi:hypothetical protein
VIWDLEPVAGAEVLMGMIAREELWLEDHHAEIAWSLALLELERRASLHEAELPSDELPVISYGGGWYQRASSERRAA